MNFNKKFDRLRRWGDEKLGTVSKTDMQDDFKAMEQEMNVRHKGTERLHGSVCTYVKAVSEKKNHPETKEKLSPMGNVGLTMSRHGQELDDTSVYAQCLIAFGNANERLARIQDTHASDVTDVWVEPLDRSLVQLKDYQASRKKLESRRLAYDTSLDKKQRAKKDDYRFDDELRSQKIKYEESMDDVCRRMEDISEAEAELTTDLYALLEAELEYHSRCREVLLQLKQTWPASAPAQSHSPPPSAPRSRRSTLSRQPTTLTIPEHHVADEEVATESSSDEAYRRPALPKRPSQPSSPGHYGAVRTPLANTLSNSDSTLRRPVLHRANTSTSAIRPERPNAPFRTRSAVTQGEDVFADTAGLLPPRNGSADDSSAASSYSGRDNGLSRNTSWSTLEAASPVTPIGAGWAPQKKATPPPPPPSRRRESSVSTKKGPAPPVPVKKIVATGV